VVTSVLHALSLVTAFPDTDSVLVSVWVVVVVFFFFFFVNIIACNAQMLLNYLLA